MKTSREVDPVELVVGRSHRNCILWWEECLEHTTGAGLRMEDNWTISQELGDVGGALKISQKPYPVGTVIGRAHKSQILWGGGNTSYHRRYLPWGPYRVLITGARCCEGSAHRS